MILKVENLVCGYPGKFHLRGVNLEVSAGEVVGIIGPNGAGKTTLLKALAGILKPEEGRILLGGQNLQQIPGRRLAQQVAVVSQNAEPPAFTVEEFVLLGRFPHFQRLQFMENRRDREIAAGCMEATGILHLRDKLMNQISGGEKQLTLIARALSQEPQLLLLDEPTAHLDISHQVKILDLLRRMNRRLKLTVVTVLHDLNLAAEYADRLLLMNNGALYRQGTPEEVLTYTNIEEVYQTIVVVEKNRVSGKPWVLFVSEENRSRAQTTPGRG